MFFSFWLGSVDINGVYYSFDISVLDFVIKLTLDTDMYSSLYSADL